MKIICWNWYYDTFAEAYIGKPLITRQKLGNFIKAKILTTNIQAVRIVLCAPDRDRTWFNDRPDISKAPFAEQKFMVRAVLPVCTFLMPLKQH